MLVEYLKGESGGDEEQASSRECGALVVLGNSLDIPRRTADDLKNSVRASDFHHGRMDRLSSHHRRSTDTETI